MRRKSLCLCFGSTVLALIVGACSPPAQPPAAAEREGAEPASPVAEAPRLHPAAIEAIAVLEDTAKRCENVGRHALQRLDHADESFHPNDSFEYYLDHGAALDLAIAREAQGVIAGLVGEVRHQASLEVGRSINDMSVHCDRLCAHVATKSFRPETYASGFHEYLKDFENARNRLRRDVDVSPAELAAALLKHQPEIERAAQARLEPEADLAAEPPARRLSPEEYARKQAEWQAHSDRLEREQTAAEAVVNDWRQQRSAQPPPPMAKVGLRAPAPSVVRNLGPWYAAYQTMAEPVKAALARYRALAKSADPGLQGACAELVNGAQAALADRTVVSCPEQALNRRVVAFFEAAKGLADACLAGQTVESAFRHQTAERALQDLESSLRGYSLAP